MYISKLSEITEELTRFNVSFDIDNMLCSVEIVFDHKFQYVRIQILNRSGFLDDKRYVPRILQQTSQLYCPSPRPKR